MEKGKFIKDKYIFYEVSEEIQKQMPDTPEGWRPVWAMNIFEYIWYKIKEFFK